VFAQDSPSTSASVGVRYDTRAKTTQFGLPPSGLRRGRRAIGCFGTTSRGFCIGSAAELSRRSLLRLSLLDQARGLRAALRAVLDRADQPAAHALGRLSRTATEAVPTSRRRRNDS
jgi:hypothetical protein